MKMKVGAKIGTSFAALILILAVLGGVAVWKMSGVEERAAMLHQAYVPEAKIANEIERQAVGAMFEMRGYAYTGEEPFLVAARQRLADVKKALAEAGALAARAAHLKMLNSKVEDLESHVGEYVRLTDEAGARDKAYDANYNLLVETGGRLLSVSKDFYAMQLKALSADFGAVAETARLEERLNKLNLSKEIHDLANNTRMAVLRSMALRDPQYAEQADANFELMAQKVAVLRGITRQEVNIVQLNEIDAAAKGYRTNMGELMANWKSINELAAKRAVLGEEILASAKETALSGMAETETIANEAVSSLTSASRMVIIGLIVALLIGIVLAVMITRAITGPIIKGVALAEEIARGDFSQRLNMQRYDEIGTLANALDSMAEGLQANANIAEQIAGGNLDVHVTLASEKDQLGRALILMTDSLNDLLGQTQVAGEQIASGSVQVSDASQSLSQGATESASSLEEITASMHEMGAQTRQNAENATQASQLAGNSREVAERGNQQMQAMVSAMSEINESGRNISKIIKVIDEIAFQTNLLALNAAVEAARAGQHGKGFAVVAEEVRNLAARSAKAASETAELIEGSVKKAENGAEIADRTAEALIEIVSGVTKVTDLVAEIAAASNEQAQGISQVNQGLMQIDQVTQQNTANAEESAAAAEELSSQATQMRQMLARFTLRRRNPTEPGLQWVRPVAVAVREISKESGRKPLPSKGGIDLDDAEFGRY